MLVNVRQVSKELFPRHWGKKKLLFGYSGLTPWARRICTCISLIVSTENKKRILIRSEFSIMSKTWGMLISSAFFFAATALSEQMENIVEWLNLFWLFYVSDNNDVFKKMSNNDFTMMMMMIPVAGITAAEGQEVRVLQIENSGSPPPYFFSICRTQCCLRLAYHYRISASQVKQNILGSKLSFG